MTDAAGGGTRSGTKKEAVPVLDLGFRQRVEVGDDLRPGPRAGERGDAVLQLLLEHQGEE